MTVIEYLRAGTELLGRSPLRTRGRGSDLPLPNGRGYTEELARIVEEADVLRRKVAEPLKVVIMGEVKAGKSTLLNALVGREVSPVDLCEATSCIIEVSHAEREGGVVLFRGREPLEDTVEAVVDLLARHRGDEDFFREVETVRLAVRIPALPYLWLVDTPGLATVTDAHIRRTEGYVQQSDVVLWVLNAGFLGQADVEESLAMVAKSGKPVVAVVNRIDEVDADPERLISYAQQNLGIYVQKVLALSAYEAFRAVQAGADPGERSPGFAALVRYLEEANVRAREVQAASLRSSLEALLRRDLRLHREVQHGVRRVAYELQLLYDHLDQIAHHISSSLEAQFERAFSHDLFEEQRRNLEAAVNSGRISNGAAAAKYLQEALARDRVAELISREWERIHRQFHEEWQRHINSMGAATEDEDGVPTDGTPTALRTPDSWGSLPSVEFQPAGDFLEGAKHGALIGSVAGGVLAAWAAWLGPYAAAISLTTALSSLVPPLALAGAAVGVLAKLLHSRRQRDELLAEATRVFQQMAEQIRSEAKPRFAEWLRQNTEYRLAKLRELARQRFPGAPTREGLAELDGQLETYCAAVERFLGPARA